MRTPKDIVEAIEDKLVSAQRASDSVFDDVEMTISSFGQKVGKLMNGPAFQALKKIMDADRYVEKQTGENEAMVEYFEEHERVSVPWMKTVLKALTDEHDSQLKDEFMQEMADKDFNKREVEQSDATFTNVRGLVGSMGIGSDTSELERMRLSSTRMLTENAAEAAEEDAKNSQALTDEVNVRQEDQQNTIDSAETSLKATQAVVNGASGGVNDLQHGLEDVLKQEEERIQGNKDKIKAESKRVSDALFYNNDLAASSNETTQSSTIEAAAAPAAAEALVQKKSHHHTASEMASLLQEASKLTDSNEKLDHHHAELGMEIEHLTASQKGKKHVSLR